jgi:stalled ribosome rescue protein Dom34
MKIVKKIVNFKKKVFAVKMNLDVHTDDVWNVYNLLSVGDLITGTCHRKILSERPGLTKIEKRTITCTLEIKSFVYDTETDTLRINGVNATENRWLGKGEQQSMDV